MTTDTPRVAAGNLGALEGRAALDAAISEKAFAQQVVDAARLTGWLVYRTFDSRRSPAGFPDLVLVRGGRLMFWELKTMRGRLSSAQLDWLAALADAGADAMLVSPRDWDAIVEMLR